ncbi:MAG: GNAT family N-acetyltransferase [Gemmatimonadota bacterium]
MKPDTRESLDPVAGTVIRTKRLDLRRFADSDAEFIMRLVNEPSFLEGVGDKGVRTLDDARRYIREGPVASYEKHGFGLYLAIRREDDAAVGMCGLLKRDTLEDADLGFAMLPEFCSLGYASEAARAALSRAWSEHGLARVVAITSPDNHASIRVLENTGFAFEKMIRLSDDAPEIRLFAIETQTHVDTNLESASAEPANAG